MPRTRQFPHKKQHRLHNGAARLFHAIDRALDDTHGWGNGPEQKAIDRALWTLMATLVAALVISQLAMHYHVSVNWFGA